MRAGTKGWQAEFETELAKTSDMSRVHFMGRVDYATYRKVLQVSRTHCYLTYPFVLSWSMLEAMSAGGHLVASDTAPVQEVITDGENGTLVDFFDTDQIAETLIEALDNPEKFGSLRAAARQTVVENYDLNTACLPKLVELVEGMAGAA